MKHMKSVLLICLAILLVAGCASGTDSGNTYETDTGNLTDEIAGSVSETAGDTERETFAGCTEAALPETTAEVTVPPVFEDVDEKVYAADNVNIRAGYSMDAEILAVLYRGKSIVRTGYSDEWSRVMYNDTECYAASAYLSYDEPETETPMADVKAEQPALPFDIASLNTASQTSQIVAAVGDGSVSGCTVYLFEKGSDGVWSMTLETPAHWGRNGISYHTVEGDQTTPAGSFDLGVAFGIRSNPGTALEWLDVNEYMYWIDDINSEYYNLLIDSREVPDGWSSGEHLIDYAGSYEYAVNIEVNPGCIRPDSTSAIFLHCGNSASAGCVSVPEESMVTILQRLKPGAKMVIAENSSAVYKY